MRQPISGEYSTYRIMRCETCDPATLQMLLYGLQLYFARVTKDCYLDVVISLHTLLTSDPRTRSLLIRSVSQLLDGQLRSRSSGRYNEIV